MCGVITYTGYIDAGEGVDGLAIQPGQITVHYVVDGSLVAVTTSERSLRDLGTAGSDLHSLFSAAGDLLARGPRGEDLQAAFSRALPRAARLVRTRR